MAQRKNESTGAANTAPHKTAAEMQEWYEANKDRLEKFDVAMSAIKELRDITKDARRTMTTFNKETVTLYLKNITAYESK